MAGFVAELIGALFVGLWLLLFERQHDSARSSTRSGTGGDGGYLGAFLAAGAARPVPVLRLRGLR